MGELETKDLLCFSDIADDFHWYRLDDNRKWTHKPGSTPITNLDSNKVEINDPRTAAMGWYHFVCFMTTDRNDVCIA